jgi:hypothetical protein
VLSLIAWSHPDVLAGLSDRHAAAKVVPVKLPVADALLFDTAANRKQQQLAFLLSKADRGKKRLQELQWSRADNARISLTVPRKSPIMGGYRDGETFNRGVTAG